MLYDETLNNTCAPGHNCGTLASALKDTGRAAWNTVLGAAQSVPNFLSGSLPGYPGYVPFLQGAMLPYDDPDFGSPASLVGTVGVAALAVGSAATTGAAGGSRASASSSIVTAGDADLANVYSNQVQGVATNSAVATTQDAYSFYTQQAQTLNVSTAPSTAVFYSGPGNRALAEEFATTNGSTTL
ncbi:hypothetical protein [Paraburkholderia antibiotica]|uniref:hypothetical protein n=1 Tax=Paraburkholderia antibiotica TaxID=2728839 RepID=UPI001E62C8A7|nr:hypothetical protein [Paraburkholderia antibiotica]